MSAFADLNDDEAALFALMTDETGIDQAEFLWADDREQDRCFRLRDYQWWWFINEQKRQASQSGRNVGKTLQARCRAFAFPFCYPGRDMLVTAPELNHLQPLVSEIEDALLGHWFSRGLLSTGPRGSMGIVRQPAWEASFANKARIVSRLPGKTGKGVKGQHCTVILLDEAQDFPSPSGWSNIVECLNADEAEARWLVYGVSNGVRDNFYDITTDPNSGWKVHRYAGIYRSTWSDEERNEKVVQYKGEESPEYLRNVWGDHGDASSNVFVLHRLMGAVDTDMESVYNQDIYHHVRVTAELHEQTGSGIQTFLANIPRTHLSDYSAVYAGADIGWVSDPTEILVFGRPKAAKTDLLELILRVSLLKISSPNQARVVREIFRFYGPLLQSFAMDATGGGLPIFQWLQEEEPSVARRIRGYAFSEKGIVGFDDREATGDEAPADLGIRQNLVDFATDELRRLVDGKQIRLPFDREILGQWQGQTRSIGAGFKSSGYRYSRGNHCLDAAKMMILPKALAAVDAVLAKQPEQEDVIDQFMFA